MNRDQISAALSGIDPKYIEEAADGPVITGKWRIKALVPLAACAALLVTATLALSNFLEIYPPLDSSFSGGIVPEILSHLLPKSPATKGCPLHPNPAKEATEEISCIDLASEDFLPMDRETLLDYYGVDLPISDVLPQLVPVDPPDGGIYRRKGGTGAVYHDANHFLFVSADGEQRLTVGLVMQFGPPSAPWLPETEELQFTPVNGRELVVFSPWEGRLYVEWKQDSLHWYVSGDGLSHQDFYAVLERLVKPGNAISEHRFTGTLHYAVNTLYDHGTPVKTEILGLTLEGEEGTFLHITPPYDDTLQDVQGYDRATVVWRGEPALIDQVCPQQILEFTLLKGE